MSDHPNRRQLRRKKRDALTLAAQLRGCICDPDFRHRGYDADGIERVTILHDDWCLDQLRDEDTVILA